MEKIVLYSKSVQYEKNAYEGIKYLRDDLDFNEARVFFDQARSRGKAQFEDDNERQFTLLYKNQTYILERR